MNCSGAPAQYQAACKKSVAESFDRSYEEELKQIIIALTQRLKRNRKEITSIVQIKLSKKVGR